MTKPILPIRPRPAATVTDLAAFRIMQGGDVLSRQQRIQAIVGSSVSTTPLTSIDHSVSNVEMSFAAMTRGLIDAQQQGKITSFGATLGTLEDRSEGDVFFQREGGVTIDGTDYILTMFSITRKAGEDEKDTTYPERRLDESVAMLEDVDGTRIYIYADAIDGVPQIDDSNCWWALQPDGKGGTKAQTFRDFAALHHPSRRAELAEQAAMHEMAEPKGWSVGTHRARTDGRHLEIAGGTEAKIEPPPRQTLSLSNQTRAKGKAAKIEDSIS